MKLKWMMVTLMMAGMAVFGEQYEDRWFYVSRLLNNDQELADVEERIVESFEQLKQRELWTKAIDYTRVEEKLVPMREFSRNWLKNALTARRNAPSSKELQLWKTLEHDRKIYEQAEEIKRLRQLVEQQGAEIKKLLDQH